MKKIILSCLISLYALGLYAHKDKTVTEKKNAPWMDSVIAEGVRKISEADFYLRHPDLKKKADPFQELNLGSFMIVIDAAKWTPNVVPNIYSYEKTGTGPWGGPNNALEDSILDYNYDHISNPSNYVAFYNIIINNFPLELSKDVSTVGNNSNQIMFTQLQQLKAIEDEPYKQATACFYQIMENIAGQVEDLPDVDDIVILGSANLLGQYGNKDQMRASYLAQTVVIKNIDTNLPWVGQLGRIPDFFKVPFVQLEPPTLAQRNTTVALAIRNFLDCNIYSICRPDNTIFTSPYAQWLYGNLAGNPNIDQAKLMNTALILNGLKNEMAWSVLTVEYESGHDQYVSTPLGPIYNAYTNGTLDTIALLSRRIQRAEWSLKNDANIYRDSALYYGWLLYRVPSYISGISTAQRVHLLDVITHASCPDINGAFDAMDYEKHCERVCKSLYTYLTPGQERNFIEQLKSSGVIWNLSYRVDNSTSGFFGEDNYTDYIFTLSSYWEIAYPEKLDPPLANNLNHIAIKWQSDFFDENGAVVVEPQLNEVRIFQKPRDGTDEGATSWWEEDDEPYEMDTWILDIYDPVTIHVAEGSLLPDIPSVKDLTVPAIFLEWLYRKKAIDDLGTTAHTSLMVASLITGVGEFYAATSMSLRAISAIQVVVAAGDLVVMNQTARSSIIGLFPTVAEGEEFLELYQEISLAVNMTVLARSLVMSFRGKCTQYSTKFDANQNALKTSLGENSAEYKAMQKLRGECGPVMNMINNGDMFYTSPNDLARTYDLQLSLQQSVRNQIYDLYVAKNWEDLESYFVSNQLNSYNGRYYPPANGGYNTKIIQPKRGMKFDRYQESFDGNFVNGKPVLTGKFTSPKINNMAIDYNKRALAVTENENALYYEIEILQDLPFTGEEAEVIPWFGSQYGGLQTKFNFSSNFNSWNSLADQGYVKITILGSPNGQFQNLTGTVIE